METDQPTPTEKPKRRAGRPRAAAEPATAFDAWGRENEYTSPMIADLLRDAAIATGLPPSLAPSASYVDQLRRGQGMPSLVVAWLIRYASASAVDLEHWVRDAMRRGDPLKRG